MTLLLLTLLGCQGSGAPTPRTHPARPNILVIDIDTLSADRMDAKYGDEWALPTLHAVADRGVRFTQAVAQAGWTVPALSSLLTGRYPLSLDLSQTAASIVEKDARLLPSILHMYDYHSSAIWSKGVPQLLTQLDAGFESQITRDVAVGADENPESTYDKWFDSKPQEPFFLLLHEFDLQIPGTTFTDKRAHDFGDEGLLCFPAEYDDTFRMLQPVVGTAKAREHTLRHYDAVAHAYDEVLGHFLARLDREGLLENTVVMITSNHGQDFAEHSGGVTHGSVYDTVLRVPLIFAGPGVTAKGRVIDTPVQTVDFAPTLLELAGVPVDRKMAGRSLAPLLAGAEPDKALHDRAIYSLTNTRTMSVRTPTRKLIMQDWSDRQVTLARRAVETTQHDRKFNYYDLTNDPGEQHDLFPTEPEKALDLIQALMGFRADRTAAAQGGTSVKIDPAMRDIFRKNGYWSIVDSGKDAGAPIAVPRPGANGRRPRSQRLPQ